MISPSQPVKSGFGSFRTRLLIAMMLVVTVVTALALFFAQRNLAANVRRDLEREFQDQVASFHSIQEVRRAALAERCSALARLPRIHAALEDNALDLLYPSARDELRDVMDADSQKSREPAAPAFHARFYRFLDDRGAVISPPDARDVGRLLPAEEAQLALRLVPDTAQIGYLRRESSGSGETIDEVIAMPVVSTESGRPIAALVLGFKPVALPGTRRSTGMISGIWSQGWLFLPAMTEAARQDLAGRIARELTSPERAGHSFPIQLDGSPCLLFYLRINPDSLFAPAYEVCIYPLTASIARQRRLLWQYSGAGGLLLLGAFIASHVLSRRLSRPVEKLAVDSEENLTQRQRAEAALDLTHEELQRSVRFSADASHQLKTPVTVLRAGLEELLAGEKLAPEVHEEVAALVHQTFRLTSMIEDLLLLSRMDAGRLQLTLTAVNLSQLIEGWLDDLGALPDPLELAIVTEFPSGLLIKGEKRYTTLILQNLLENARKYNRHGGRIRISARPEGGQAVLIVGNTGATIPAGTREHIFQRFHRGTVGEDVPGHGLGLNLARELARLHHGELRLVRSEADWTEFEVRFHLAQPVPVSGLS